MERAGTTVYSTAYLRNLRRGNRNTPNLAIIYL